MLNSACITCETDNPLKTYLSLMKSDRTIQELFFTFSWDDGKTELVDLARASDSLFILRTCSWACARALRKVAQNFCQEIFETEKTEGKCQMLVRGIS